MPRVCGDVYPKGYYPRQKGDGFWLNDILKSNLDALLKNASKEDDWDFVILITGGGRVRVGKSMLALQIAQYWSHQLNELYKLKTNFTIKDNIVFHGHQLIKKGHKLAEKQDQGVIIFDEAGADLEGLKVIRRSTQAVKDYLRECGQYNFLTILVLPEFFDLPKGIATTRSDLLLDVYRSVSKDGKFVRGFFNFYSWPTKRKLYLFGKRDLNYNAYRYDFHGRFYKFYPIDEKEYREAKRLALLSRKEDEEKKAEPKWKIQRDVLIKYLINSGLTQQKVVEIFKEHGIKITQAMISDVIHIIEPPITP